MLNIGKTKNSAIWCDFNLNNSAKSYLSTISDALPRKQHMVPPKPESYMKIDVDAINSYVHTLIRQCLVSCYTCTSQQLSFSQ